VIFSHDTEHALLAIVGLVNTSPELAGEEGLPDVDALAGFVGEYDVSEVGTLDADDLVAVRRLRGRLHQVFLAESDAAAAGLINDIIAVAPMTPRLTDHDGFDWHIHYFAPGASLAEHLAVDGGVALAQVLAAGEYDRLRTCAAPDCAQVLVDLSRNRSKRYCDARTCGNRLHVAAYRERQRAAIV
jgi:hypothetical protein